MTATAPHRLSPAAARALTLLVERGGRVTETAAALAAAAGLHRRTWLYAVCELERAALVEHVRAGGRLTSTYAVTEIGSTAAATVATVVPDGGHDHRRTVVGHSGDCGRPQLGGEGGGGRVRPPSLSPSLLAISSVTRRDKKRSGESDCDSESDDAGGYGGGGDCGLRTVVGHSGGDHSRHCRACVCPVVERLLSLLEARLSPVAEREARHAVPTSTPAPPSNGGAPGKPRASREKIVIRSTPDCVRAIAQTVLDRWPSIGREPDLDAVEPRRLDVAVARVVLTAAEGAIRGTPAALLVHLLGEAEIGTEGLGDVLGRIRDRGLVLPDWVAPHVAALREARDREVLR